MIHFTRSTILKYFPREFKTNQEFTMLIRNLSMLALFLVAAPAAFAMPCDVSAVRYDCRSASGKYELNVLTCGYDDALKNWDLTVSGKSIGTNLDGSWMGAMFMGFQISVPDTQNDAHSVTFEVNNKTMTGTVTEISQASDPGPTKTIGTENVSCTESND